MLPPEGREGRLTIRGRPVRYRAAGDGPPVVLVPGLGLSADFYRRSYPAFARAGLRLIAPDLPGTGESPGPRGGLAVPELRAWLLAFADALGLEAPAWIGHSIGAQPALAVAAHAPKRARALVLASPTGAPGRARRLRQIYALALDVGREPRALFPAVAREYLRASPLATAGTWLKAARDRPLARARRVRCPALIVAGTNDPVVPDDYLCRLRRALPDARTAHVPGGAHGMMFTRAEAFNRVTTEFLRTDTPRPQCARGRPR